MTFTVNDIRTRDEESYMDFLESNTERTHLLKGNQYDLIFRLSSIKQSKAVGIAGELTATDVSLVPFYICHDEFGIPIDFQCER